MDDYQREILEKALKFYERFALPQSRDPQVRLEAARAGMRVGAIRSRLGQTVAAEQADRQALEILRRLVADQPAEPTIAMPWPRRIECWATFFAQKNAGPSANGRSRRRRRSGMPWRGSSPKLPNIN